jgi:hypothetical protein
MNHYKRPRTFEQAIAIRKRALKKFKTIEKEYRQMRSKLQEIEVYCGSLKSYDHVFKPYLELPSINFSGFED